MLTRREFLAAGLAATGGLLVNRLAAQVTQTVPSGRLNVHQLQPFIEVLPTPGIARPQGLRAGPAGTRLPHYRLAMREFVAKVHRDLPPTRMWGYEGISPGPTIEASVGEPLEVE